MCMGVWVGVCLCVRGRSTPAANGMRALSLFLQQLWRVRATSRPLPPSLPPSSLSLSFPHAFSPSPSLFASLNPSFPQLSHLLIPKTDRVFAHTQTCIWFSFKAFARTQLIVIDYFDPQPFPINAVLIFFDSLICFYLSFVTFKLFSQVYLTSLGMRINLKVHLFPPS